MNHLDVFIQVSLSGSFVITDFAMKSSILSLFHHSSLLFIARKIFFFGVSWCRTWVEIFKAGCLFVSVFHVNVNFYPKQLSSFKHLLKPMFIAQVIAQDKKNTSSGLKGTLCETLPCARRERRRPRGRAGTGRDRDVEELLKERMSLRRGLWRVRREAKVGRE